MKNIPEDINNTPDEGEVPVDSIKEEDSVDSNATPEIPLVADEDVDTEEKSKKQKKQKNSTIYVVERDFYVKRRLVTVKYKKGQQIESENIEFMKNISAPIVRL